MNRKAIYLFAILFIALLFSGAYLTKIPWLWILAGGSLAVTIIFGLRHFVNSILEEHNEGVGEKQGRMFFLPRPSGLGSQVRPDVVAGSANSILIKQEKKKGDPAGETHAYLPESSWASSADKGEDKKES